MTNEHDEGKGKFIVEYQNELYDISEFMSKHPGGVNTLNGYNRKNIDNKFQSIEHSPAAEYLLKSYKLRTGNSEFDESMEHLIDWNSALMPQIHKLQDKYSEWVNKPVDRTMRLFEHPLLEMISKTPWYFPLVFWIPIIIYLIFKEAANLPESSDYKSVYSHMVMGIALWTLLEYTLHRFLFHMNIDSNPEWSTFHFVLHGIHHKVPFDENRLVFPPLPAAVLALIIYQPVHLISSVFADELFNPRLLIAGGLIGYLCYDMIHYYIHYGSPRNQYFYHLKRYHYNHHFVSHDKGFGISSPLWDALFGTRLYLKKLQVILKW